MIILYSVIADDGSVLSHKTSSEMNTIAASIPVGLKAVVGRHVPFNETVDVENVVDFWVTGEAQPVEPQEPTP